MDSILYLNNFRGFEKSYLSLADVNFFVGENSTGKTSILRLLKILSEGDFWLREGFETMEDEFGVFNEITDAPFFEVAHTIYSRGKTVRFVKLTFTQKKNRIEIDQFAALDEFHSVHVKVFPNTYRYRLTIEDNSAKLAENVI